MRHIKNRQMCLCFVILATILSSCSPSRTLLTKDTKYMPIHFKPLARTDFKIVGGLQSETEISGKIKYTGKVLAAKYRKNYKQGLQKEEQTQITYFAPSTNEVITGSLYAEDVFNSIYTPSVSSSNSHFLGNLINVKTDPAVDFAYYDMVAKYPNIDYFVNVRFDRKFVSKGKSFTEVVTVKADGIVLNTD